MFAALLCCFSLLLPPDTLILPGNKVVRLELISRAVFEAAPKPVVLRGFLRNNQAQLRAERIRLATQRGLVTRRDSLLILHPSHAAPVTLLTGIGPDSDEASIERYVFLAALPEIRQWLMEMATYCFGMYKIVDQRTGKVSVLSGYPSLAPSRRRLGCISNDETGSLWLQVWRLNPRGELTLWWQRIWEGADGEVRWQDDRTLLLKCQDFSQIELADPSKLSNWRKARTHYYRLRLPN